jgi:hypothetical protein
VYICCVWGLDGGYFCWMGAGWVSVKGEANYAKSMQPQCFESASLVLPASASSSSNAKFAAMIAKYF